MPMLRVLRLVNALENGTISGAQLETLLTDAVTGPSRRAELTTVLGLRGQSRRVSGNTTTMSAITGSNAAMTIVVSSETACVAIKSNFSSNNQILGAASLVGAYLDRLRQSEGLTSDGTLASLASMTTIAANASAMLSVSSSSLLMAVVTSSNNGTTAIKDNATANSTALASSFSVGAYLDRIRIISGSLGDGTLSSMASMNAIAASSASMALIAASTLLTTIIKANVAANNTLLGSSFSVGAYLDRIRIIGGSATNATLAALGSMAAVAESTTAMSAVIAPAATGAILASSSPAMAVIWASAIATPYILSTTASKTTLYDSDIALNELQKNPTRLQLIINSYAASASSSSINYTFRANNTGKSILLRRYYNNNVTSENLSWGRANGGILAASGGRSLLTNATPVGCVSGTYTPNGIVPMTDDVTANFVAAANGINRGASVANYNSGYPDYTDYYASVNVRYIAL